MHQEVSEQLITWDQEEGWNVTALIFIMWSSLFCHFGIFWRPPFSVTASVRHLGSTRTENLDLQNLVVPRRHLNCLSLASAPRASINPKPAPVAHLEFLTTPPKLNPSNLKGQSRSQQRKESTGAGSPLGALSPEVFRLFSHTSTFKEICRRLSPQVPCGHAILWAGDEPCCDGSVFPWTSWCCVWGDSLGFFMDFLVPCVRCAWCLRWQKCHLGCQQLF